jgi:hypothetical protein
VDELNPDYYREEQTEDELGTRPGRCGGRESQQREHGTCRPALMCHHKRKIQKNRTKTQAAASEPDELETTSEEQSRTERYERQLAWN